MKSVPVLLLALAALAGCRSRGPATASYVDFQCICGDLGKRYEECRHPTCAEGRRNPENPKCRCGERTP